MRAPSRRLLVVFLHVAIEVIPRFHVQFAVTVFGVNVLDKRILRFNGGKHKCVVSAACLNKSLCSILRRVALVTSDLVAINNCTIKRVYLLVPLWISLI